MLLHLGGMTAGFGVGRIVNAQLLLLFGADGVVGAAAGDGAGAGRDHAHVRAAFLGGYGGAQAGHTGTDDNDIVGNGLGNLALVDRIFGGHNLEFPFHILIAVGGQVIG